MTTDQAREIFTRAIATESSPERVAVLELLREYFTNSEFRAAFHDHVYSLNSDKLNISADILADVARDLKRMARSA